MQVPVTDACEARLCTGYRSPSEVVKAFTGDIAGTTRHPDETAVDGVSAMRFLNGIPFRMKWRMLPVADPSVHEFVFRLWQEVGQDQAEEINTETDGGGGVGKFGRGIGGIRGGCERGGQPGE